jgi:hypothetical protein
VTARTQIIRKRCTRTSTARRQSRDRRWATSGADRAPWDHGARILCPAERGEGIFVRERAALDHGSQKFCQNVSNGSNPVPEGSRDRQGECELMVQAFSALHSFIAQYPRTSSKPNRAVKYDKWPHVAARGRCVEMSHQGSTQSRSEHGGRRGRPRAVKLTLGGSLKPSRTPRTNSLSERTELYRSSNGDTWFLGREPANGHAFVIHQPNAPSGGRLSHI